MTGPAVTDLAEGTQLTPLDLPPLTRTTLALYAGGSGDHVPLHIDTDFARIEAGMDDVIGHGMLTMAYLGRYLLSVAPQDRLRKFSTRFVGMSHVGDTIQLTGAITRNQVDGANRIVEAELNAVTGDGTILATGTACWAFDEQDHGA